MMSITIADGLQQTIKQLLDVDQAKLEAELLMAHVLNQPRSYLYAHGDELLTTSQEKILHQLLARRNAQEPLAYILGEREFWSLTFKITPATLIPRPETELIVETVLNLIDATQTAVKVADLGTGSGAIAIALAHERPRWQIYATDQSVTALQVAEENAKRLLGSSKLQLAFICGNWCTALPCSEFDVIVSNPPYIAATEWDKYAQGLQYEPKDALISGEDGMDAIREIITSAPPYLRFRGYLVIEHGFLQGSAVRELFIDTGFKKVQTLRDLAGLERVTIGEK